MAQVWTESSKRESTPEVTPWHFDLFSIFFECIHSSVYVHVPLETTRLIGITLNNSIYQVVLTIMYKDLPLLEKNGTSQSIISLVSQ
jgi:hypothetical protein